MSEESDPFRQAPEGPRRRGDGWLWAGPLCGLAGLLLAIVPHIATSWSYGTWAFLAHEDDIVYLAMGRAPFYGEWTLRDPFSGAWERVPSIYAWLPIVPLAKLTRLLGLPLLGMGLVSRAVGGLLLGLTLYALFRRLLSGTTRPAAWALGCTLIGLADPGFVDGATFVGAARLAGHLARGTTPLLKADAIPQYRIISPLLVLPAMLVVVAALLPEGEGRKRPAAVALGGVGLGFCFLTYFFCWTAAVLGLGLALAWFLLEFLLRPEGRTKAFEEARAIVLVLAIGGAIGVFQIASNYRTFSTPESRHMLERMIKPLALEPGDPTRALYVRNVWIWAKLALGAAAIAWGRLPNLRLTWCVALAGYLLSNSALVTGLDFENFHWLYVYSPFGEVVVLGVAAMALDRARAGRLRGRMGWLWVLPVAMVVLAAAWRWQEAIRAPYPAWASRTIAELRPLRPALARLRPDAALAGPREANIALLETRCAQLYATPYSWVSMIPDRVLHERHALNGWLIGLELPDYARKAGKDKYADLPRPEWTTEAVGRARAEIFRRLLDRPAPELLARYRPDYLLLPTSGPEPRRAGPWSPIKRDPKWTLWERRPAPEEGREDGSAPLSPNAAK